jgi:hypothetical protein
MIYSKHFDSIASCVAYAQGDSLPLWKTEKAELRPSRQPANWQGMKWCNTQSFDEAVGLAVNGWPEGLAMVKPFADKLVGKLASKIQRETYTPAVTGQFFDIGLVMSGEPECWLETVETEQEGGAGNKVVTISFAISASAEMSKTALEERGASILALVQLLEMAGRSVRLVAILGSRYNGGSGAVDSTLVLKEASAPMNEDQLAFWLVSPDALRRLAFAVRELVSKGSIIRHGMGAQESSQHLAEADIKVHRLDHSNYRHGINQAGFEKQLIEWLSQVGITIG